MGLFKSREEKRIERDIEVRKGINSVRRNAAADSFPTFV